MGVLKIISDDSSVVTYINLDNCFSIKKDPRDANKLIFKSTGDAKESFTFKSREDLDKYIEFLDSLFDNLLINEDDEDDEEDNIKPDLLNSNYDPMANLR